MDKDSKTKKKKSEWINAAKGFKENTKDTYYVSIRGRQAKILERKYVH